MAVRTKAELAVDIATYLADNTGGDITAEDLRNLATNIVDSLAEAAGLATVATSGAYSDLSGAPTLATVATSGAYSDLSGTPTLATVATSGAYSDLSGTPTIPSTPGEVGAASSAQGALADSALQQVTGCTTIAVVTQAEYDALGTPVADRLYLITG